MEIEVVAFISDGRPDLVDGCLSAYVKNFVSYGYRPLIVLADSSNDAESRNTGRRALFKIHREYGLDTRHISNRECDAYLKRVDGSPAFDYAVNGDWRIGWREESLFNRALVACAGRAAMFIDINTLPDMMSAPGASPCLSAIPALNKDRFDPYAYELGALDVFKSEIEAEAFPRLHKVNILSLAERHLGKGFGACSSEHGIETRGRADGIIGVVQMGIWGDAGLPYSTSRLLSSVSPLSSWGGDEADYLARRDSRYTRRVASDWSVRAEQAVSRDCFALSPAALSVPFLPTGLSSSGLSVSGLLRALLSQSLCVEAPFAVRKIGEPGQTFSSDSFIRGAERMSLHDLLFVMVTMGSEGGSLRSVGSFLRIASEYTPDALASLLRIAARSWARKMRDRAQSAKNRYTGSSATAVSDLQSLIDTYTQMLDNDDYPMPYEIRSGEYSFESDRILRRQLLRYGELLIEWQGITNEAVELRGQGIEIGARP